VVGADAFQNMQEARKALLMRRRRDAARQRRMTASGGVTQTRQNLIFLPTSFDHGAKAGAKSPAQTILAKPLRRASYCNETLRPMGFLGCRVLLCTIQRFPVRGRTTLCKNNPSRAIRAR
jgi:hypothetical protein